MNARPTSITVVSVILIVISVLSLFSTLMIIVQRNEPLVQQAMAANPLPPEAQIAMGFVGALVMLISGVAMLRAQGWGRWLFTGYYAAGGGVNVGILVLGVVLLLASRGSGRPATAQNSTNTGPGTGDASAADASNPYRSPTYPR